MKILVVLVCLFSAFISFVSTMSIAIIPPTVWADGTGVRLIFGVVFATAHLYTVFVASGTITGRIDWEA